MFRARTFAIVTAIVSFASNACATRDAAPPQTGALASCPGATLQSSAAAARYSACQVVQGDLTISLSDATDLSALAQLRHVTGTLRISHSPQLDDLSGLERLTSVGALEIRDNSELDDLAGISQLSRVGRIEITGNPELASLRGLDAVTETGRVELRSNGLYNVTGLGGLQRARDVVIEGNHKLNSLVGLRNLERASSLSIRNNPMLCGAGLLPSLTRVDGAVVLRDNRGVSQREARLVLERTGQDTLTPSVASQASNR